MNGKEENQQKRPKPPVSSEEQRRALLDLHRLGRRSQKLFRLVDSGTLPSKEHNKLVTDLERIQKQYLEKAKRFHIDPKTLKILHVKETTEEPSPPQVSLPPEVSFGKEAVVVSFSSRRRPMRESGSHSPFDDEMSEDILYSMLKREANLLAKKITTSKVGGNQSGERILEIAIAEELATELALNIKASPELAVLSAIGGEVQRDLIRELLL